ncbi:MAG: hypothetical protein ACFFDW_07580, partial [Candidatus Thorarchaeota archaeon]
STLANNLSEELGGIAVLKFDDYFEFLQGWPKDIRKWVDEGAEINDWKNPRLKEDLEKLLHGEEIIYPTTGEKIRSSSLIIVEDPSGRGRKEMRDYIDHLVYLDIPNEISLMRSMTRWLNSEMTKKDGSRVKRREEQPAELLENMLIFVKKYLDSYRDMYHVVCDRVKEDADIILDGQNSPKELVKEFLAFLEDNSNDIALEGIL